jgi:hypothetical protein
MHKTKIKKFSPSISSSKKSPEMSLRKDTGLRKSNPTEELLDEDLIGRAVWERGDAEGVIEVISIYLEAANKTQIAKETSIAHTLKSKNTTIRTLAKLVHACV